MTRHLIIAAAALAALTGAASAEDISTHVLDISTGQGAAGIPVTLEIERDGAWSEIGAGTTGDNGRVEGFGVEAGAATYRLHFDMTGDAASGNAPFFPEIAITFAISDAGRHHHVPVLVSPFGYSTYLGN